MKNYYSTFPVLPYQKTTVLMNDVVDYIRSLNIDVSLKIAVYIIFRNESANGTKGINNNYIGLQSDAGRWLHDVDKHVTGTCIVKENMTGKERGFLCFARWQCSVDILVSKLHARGLYIGGTTYLITKLTIYNIDDFAEAYYKEWVTGNAKASIPDNELSGIKSMYKQALKLFY